MTSRTRIALLRGINVGRAKRVAMADLRSLLSQLGYGDIRTVLNSGNAVFTINAGETAAKSAARIEQALDMHLGVVARVTVLTAAELATAVAENPLLDRADNPSRLLVAVLADPKDLQQLKPLVKQAWAPDALALGARVAYLWCPNGVLASRLNEAVARALGDSVTARNWATMLKLHGLAQ